MPKIQLSHRVEFCAAYKLANPNFDEEWNKQTYGPCFSENYHGHNFLMTVLIGGEVDPDTGMVIDLLELQNILQSQIVDKFDHKNLNLDVPEMKGVIATSENLAGLCWDLLEQHLPQSVTLDELVLAESRDNKVILRR